jgi:hypothetical protein
MADWLLKASGVEMARVGRKAPVSSWLLSVAEVLPLPHRSPRPYTVGEAVAELGAYAQAIDSTKWKKSPADKNRESLRAEIQAQSVKLGERLRFLLTPLLGDLHDDSDQNAAIATVARFAEAWHSEDAIASSFEDLCDAAKDSRTTGDALRSLAANLAAQIGPAAHGSFSPLSNAADALAKTEDDSARRSETPMPTPLTEARRLEMAKTALMDAPEGQVTVWLVYYRATLSGMRAVAGPMTFLRPEWALPNAFGDGQQHFAERAELQELRTQVRWLDQLHDEALKMENRLVLVRIDLGERQFAGAIEEARRRIDAVLSVAVKAGGVSWQSAGADTVLLNGIVRSSAIRLNLRNNPEFVDEYGMEATAEALTSVAEQLGDALASQPMPEDLVEALISLREARMTDHRDIRFYGARPTTPRVATALEDHAMELIASLLDVHPEELAITLQKHETLLRADREVATQLTAPFHGAWAEERHEGRDELQREIVAYRNGHSEVSIAKAVDRERKIRALPMSDLQRADFENALAICTKPELEQGLLDETWRRTSVLRARHRRVRNAVSHGLPLDRTTLNSVRDYAESTSVAALDIALTWFKSGEKGATLLEREKDSWSERMDRIGRGISWRQTEESK